MEMPAGNVPVPRAGGALQGGKSFQTAMDPLI